MVLELWFKVAESGKWHALATDATTSPCGIDYAARAVSLRKIDAPPEAWGWAGVVRDTGYYTGCRHCQAAVAASQGR